MSDHPAATPSRPKSKKRIWPYVAGLIVVLAWSILTQPAFIQGIAPYATASGMASGRVYFYFATHGFILAMVVWLLLSAPFVPWQGPHPAFFFVLLLAAVAPNIVMLHKAQARAGLYRYPSRLTQSGLEEAKSAALSTIRFGPQRDTAIDVQARKLGAAGQARDAWRRLLDGVAADIGGYQSRLQALGAPALDAAKLGEARQTADRAQARSAGRFAAYRSAITAITAATHGDAKALEEKGDGLRTRVDALWAKQRAILAEEEAMAASRGHEEQLRGLASEAQAVQRDMQQYASAVSAELGAAAGDGEPEA